MTNSQDALRLVCERNAFYQRLYHLVFFNFVLAVMIIGILVGVVLYLYRNPTAPLYFATDSVGRLIQIIPESEPNMSDDDAAAWAMSAVIKATSYDYINYREQLQSAKKYFTNYGWTNYMNTLTSSNNFVALKTNQMVFSAAVVGSPTMLAKGLLSGKYAWKFQLPLLVTYRSPPFDDKSKYLNAYTVEVIVQRQPTLQSENGLGIIQIIIRFANTPSS